MRDKKDYEIKKRKSNERIKPDEHNIRDIEEKRIQVKKNRNKMRLIYTMLLIIAALVSPTLIKKIAGMNADTFIVKMGTIEHSFNSKAIVFRDEVLIKSNVEGSCIPHYEEGDKVAANSVVATIVESDSQELLDSIKTLEARIMLAREEANKQTEFFKDDLKKIDDEMNKIVGKLVEMSATGNMAGSRKYEKEINNLLLKKSDILSSSNDKNAFLNQLIEQKNALQASIKDNIEEVKNTKAGTVSYSIDGYENELNFSYLNNLNLKSFNDLYKRIGDNSINNENISKTYVKMIDDLYYYFACTVNTKEVNDIKEGTIVSVRVNDKNILIEMVVESIRKDDEKSLLILRSNKALCEIVSIRTADIDVIIQNIEGLKIPIKALTDYNNISRTAKVACLKYSYVRYVPVKVIGMDKDYAIIANADEKGDYIINFNEIIITNPSKFEEGQLVY